MTSRLLELLRPYFFERWTGQDVEKLCVIYDLHCVVPTKPQQIVVPGDDVSGSSLNGTFYKLVIVRVVNALPLS